MTANQAKVASAVGLFSAWAAAIAAKHAYPDVDVNSFIMATQAALTGLGVHHLSK